MSLFPLDGPASQDTISVTTSTVQEAKIGASALSERKVVTLQPVDGKIYVYFGDGASTPSAATVIADGFVQFRNAKNSYECSHRQPVFILAVSGTVNVKVAERA